MMSPRTILLTVIAITSLQTQALAKQTGTLKVLNHSSCTYELHHDGFSSDSILSITTGDSEDTFQVSYDDNLQGIRNAITPISISCESISHVENLEFNLKNHGLSLQINPASSITQAKLVISGDTRLDSTNNQITLMILPTKVSGWSAI